MEVSASNWLRLPKMPCSKRDLCYQIGRWIWIEKSLKCIQEYSSPTTNILLYQVILECQDSAKRETGTELETVATEHSRKPQCIQHIWEKARFWKPWCVRKEVLNSLELYSLTNQYFIDEQYRRTFVIYTGTIQFKLLIFFQKRLYVFLRHLISSFYINLIISF